MWNYFNFIEKRYLFAIILFIIVSSDWSENTIAFTIRATILNHFGTKWYHQTILPWLNHIVLVIPIKFIPYLFRSSSIHMKLRVKPNYKCFVKSMFSKIIQTVIFQTIFS